MSWSLNIGRVAGTVIRIHLTFLLFLAWIFAASYAVSGAATAWNVLLFIVLFKFGDALAGIMTAPFVLDIGFDKTDYGRIVKLFGFAATLLLTVVVTRKANKALAAHLDQEHVDTPSG